MRQCIDCQRVELISFAEPGSNFCWLCNRIIDLEKKRLGIPAIGISHVGEVLTTKAELITRAVECAPIYFLGDDSVVYVAGISEQY